METYTRYNIFIITFAAFGSLFAGYGLAVIGNTIGQPTFYTTMNLVVVKGSPGYSHTSDIIGAANGIFFGAGFIGTIFAGWCADVYGRIRSFQIAAVVGIIGGSLQCSSVNEDMYLVSRAITGIATGHMMGAMPTYFSEVAPPHSRGLMTGAHGTFLNIGYSLSAWIGFACYYASKSTFGWRFPNAMLVLWAVCLLIGSFFIPESPRWLVQRNQHELAFQILCRLHHNPNDIEDTFAQRELNLIKDQIEADNAALSMDGLWSLLTKKTYRKRLILAILVMGGGQNCGVVVINNYNVLMYQSLGLTGGMALLVAAAWNTTAALGNLFGAFFSDRLGRRRAILIGYVLNTSMFSIFTGLIGQYNSTPSKTYAAVATVFAFLYIMPYGFFIDVNQFTISSEIFPSHLRSQASAIAISAFFLTDLVWLQLAPTAQATIGWKYYLVFACLSLVHLIHLYFFLPETGGMALEDVERVFEGEATVIALNERMTEDEVQKATTTTKE